MYLHTRLLPIKIVPLGLWLAGFSAGCIGGLSNGIHSSSGLSHFWGRTQHFTLQDAAELGPVMVLLAEHWLPGAVGAGVMEGGPMAWEVSGDCHYPAKGRLVEDRDPKRETSKDENHPLSGCGARQNLAVLAVPLANTAPRFPSHHSPSSWLWIIPLHPAGAGAPCQEGDVSSWRLVVMPSLGRGCSSICWAG